jgi:hypothetical protein
MIAIQQTDPFATLPRWSTTVSNVARPESDVAATDDLPSPGCSAKHRSATSFTSARVLGTGNRGCTSQPSAALKSP